MLVTTRTFENENTIYFECTYRDPMGVLGDPYNPAYTIKTSKGTEVDSGSPLKRGNGYWYIFWTPSAVGDYVLEFSGEVKGNNVKIKRPFKVVDPSVKY